LIAARPTAALLVLLLAIAVSVGACGSSSETGGGVKSTRGSDNSIQEFGSEGNASERAAAAAVLHRYLDARARRDWKAACAQLAQGLSRALARQLGVKGEEAGCERILARLSAAVPAATLRQAALAEIGSLRVEGGQAFLLFRGAGGDAYFMPMVQEGDAWKVAAIAGSPLL
jgi:hypothetical protein